MFIFALVKVYMNVNHDFFLALCGHKEFFIAPLMAANVHILLRLTINGELETPNCGER